MKALELLTEIECIINRFGAHWNLFGALDHVKSLLKELRTEIEKLE